MKRTTFSEACTEAISELREERRGNTFGMPFGLSILDEHIGKIKKGRLYLVGGFSGIGKSYFFVNIVNNLMIQEKDLKVMVFSTELKASNYMIRLACMRNEIWEMQLDNDAKKYGDTIDNELINIAMEAKSENFLVYGQAYDMDQIVEQVRQGKPDIVFIDYIQECTIGGQSKMDKKMPMLKDAVKGMAVENNCAVFVASQINQSAANEGYEDTYGNPFKFGTEFYDASDVAMKLERDRVDGKAVSELKINVIKGRRSGEALLELDIKNGYKLARKPYGYAR